VARAFGARAILVAVVPERALWLLYEADSEYLGLSAVLQLFVVAMLLCR
jgi:hypothetical protein